jgi:preprotein translocase subunit SecG
VSGGVNMWEIQKYLQNGREQVMELNGPRWTMEIYRTAMDTLSQISWVMLLFFLCAMVAYVIMRVAESSREQRRSSQRDDDAA